MEGSKGKDKRRKERREANQKKKKTVKEGRK